MVRQFMQGLLVSLVFAATFSSAAPLDDATLRSLSPQARAVLEQARHLETRKGPIAQPATNVKEAEELDALPNRTASTPPPIFTPTSNFVSWEDMPAAERISVNDEVSVEAVPAPPHWVVYGDQWVSGTNGPPAASDIQGYNVFALSFLLLAGAWDKAYEWTTYTDAQRAAVKAEYAAAGIKIVVSCFGSTDVPTSSGADATATAQKFAAWVKQYNLDGIDVDYEDFGAFDSQSGSAENWLITFTTVLRANLPASTYIISHAPVAPWFSPTAYAGGGYLKVHKSVGSSIDWYNVQFYNQGVNEYTTCANLLTTSSTTWAKTALFQIVASGVPASKLVIGKPARASGDANNGYIAPATLAQCLQTAKAQGWTGGAMVWQWPYATESWISTVRSLSWPV
ncbi:glycoside hydrolase family 18 protein [Flagelloscypha sp. PMI_526]|nr:glycoside hydrolase family 18 protein [Flagelloscypha sp. PMI_526]